MRREELSRIESDLRWGTRTCPAGWHRAFCARSPCRTPPRATKHSATLASLSSLEVLILGDTTVTLTMVWQSSATCRRCAARPESGRFPGQRRGLGISRFAAARAIAVGQQRNHRRRPRFGRPHQLTAFLILQNARITGRGFKHLHGLKNLESLYLQGNPLTGEGVAELRRTCRRCTGLVGTLPTTATTWCSMTRLEILNPDLADKLRNASANKQRAVGLAACEFAVSQSMVDEPVVREALEVLRHSRQVTEAKTKQVEGLVARLEGENSTFKKQPKKDVVLQLNTCEFSHSQEQCPRCCCLLKKIPLRRRRKRFTKRQPLPTIKQSCLPT